MNEQANTGKNSAGMAAWICVAIAWVCFLVPIPGIGLFIGWPLNFVAFILAIVAMAKRGALSGLFQLLATLIVSPVLYFIGLAVFAAMIGSIEQTTQDVTGQSPTAVFSGTTGTGAPVADDAPIEITAPELSQAYDQNEVSADSRYKGKRLKVSGIVTGIESDISDDPVVQLESGGLMPVTAQGLSKERAASLIKGQKITLLCTGAGEVLSIPQLERCATQ